MKKFSTLFHFLVPTLKRNKNFSKQFNVIQFNLN
jgi:hypothetical protein